MTTEERKLEENKTVDEIILEGFVDLLVRHIDKLPDFKEDLRDLAKSAADINLLVGICEHFLQSGSKEGFREFIVDIKKRWDIE